MPVLNWKTSHPLNTNQLTLPFHPGIPMRTKAPSQATTMNRRKEKL